MTALDDTSRCPVGHRCESCGSEQGPMEARTSHTALGVLCLTCCPRCADTGSPAPVSVTTAAKLAMEHCGHLGITIDDMAAMQADTSWTTGSAGRRDW